MTVSATQNFPQIATRPAWMAPPATQQAEAASAPVSLTDSVVRSPRTLSSVSTKSSETGNAIATTAGGMLGLGMVIPGLYAGVLGGAVVGSMLGMGIGPALAAVTTHGALGFLGATWQTAGVAARAGMFVGGASGLIGGWKTGTGIGHAVGRVFGAEKNESSEPVSMKGVKGVFASIVSGGGMASGAVGGGILGASVAASGSLLKGLAGSGFHMAALSGMGPAAAIGGIVGLVTFGVIGGVGGHSIAKNAIKAGNWIYEKATGHAHEPKQPATPESPQTKTN